MLVCIVKTLPRDQQSVVEEVKRDYQNNMTLVLPIEEQETKQQEEQVNLFMIVDRKRIDR